jgi:hypothetical protein
MCCHVLAGSRERLSWRLKGRSPRQSSSRSQGLVRCPDHRVSPIQELLPRGTWPPHPRPDTGCLETHNRRLPKTSRHLMTHTNSQSRGLKIRLLKSCSATLPEFLTWRLCDRSVHSDSNGRGRGQGAAGTSHRDHVAPNTRAGIGRRRDGIGWRHDRIGCLLGSAASHHYRSERT